MNVDVEKGEIIVELLGVMFGRAKGWEEGDPGQIVFSDVRLLPDTLELFPELEHKAVFPSMEFRYMEGSICFYDAEGRNIGTYQVELDDDVPFNFCPDHDEEEDEEANPETSRGQLREEIENKQDEGFASDDGDDDNTRET